MDTNPMGWLNILEFADNRGSLQSELAVSVLPRLAGMVADRHSGLRFSLNGIGRMGGKPALRLQIDGALSLICQRCLEPMQFTLAIDKKLRLAATERELMADVADLEDDEADLILGKEQMSIAELIEEEALLAIPFVPRHGQCGAWQQAGKETGKKTEISDTVTAKVSPFAKLARLKSSQ